MRGRRRLSPIVASSSALGSLLFLIASAAEAAPFAYVVNNGQNTVSVIDTATNTVTATVAVGAIPRSVAITADGTRVYVGNAAADNVSVIDTSSNTVIGTIDVGHTPWALTADPVGTQIYVANINDDTVSIIDTDTGTVIRTLPVGSTPVDLAVSGGGKLYVANNGTANVSVLDVCDNTSVATVPLPGGGLNAIALNPAASRAYVVAGSNTLSVIDTATNTVVATTGVGGADLAVNPAGTMVYVTLPTSVAVFDTTNNSLVTTIGVGAVAADVAFNASGSRAYVTNTGSDNVSVIDTASNTVVATVTVGTGPLRIAIASGAGPPPPVTGPRITGMEVTQGIQNLANVVELVSGRRTFVRVYVATDGAAVPGVTATLSGIGAICTISGCINSATLGPLTPVNTVGPRITVQRLPQRANLNDSFTFELPWEWTNYRSVRLQATLTTDPGPPAHTCQNALLKAPLFEFQIPATLRPLFFRMSYQLPVFFNGMTNGLYQASIGERTLSESYMRRIYPVSTLDSAPDRVLFDAGLGRYVARSPLECQLAAADQQSLCAHGYITSKLAALQAGTGLLSLFPGSAMTDDVEADVGYALIPQVPNDSTGQFFTRGACCNNKIGAGPSNNFTYAAHEIGHFLGRKHPEEGSADCGHSADDPDYPYFHSYIANPLSDLVGGFAGFDGGDAGNAIPMAYRSPATDFDIMGYCGGPYWISDYSYSRLYPCLLSLNAHTPNMTPLCGPSGIQYGAPDPQAGDWLMVFGQIAPDPATVRFLQTRRVDRVVNMPPRTPGDHSIRLIGTGGAILADYSFTPDVVEEGSGAAATAPELGFGHVVPFIAGTTTIQIVDASAANEVVVGEKTVSPNPPLVGNVALQGAPDPVTGLATVGWTASDQDGDALTFDVFLKKDDGAGALSLQPLMLGLAETSIPVDTSHLAGGSGQFRVVATDGVQSAFADSPSFVLPDKPPQLRIVTPGDGTTVSLGQLVNFAGEATDPQDWVVPDAGFAWSKQGAPLGSGPRLSLTNLPLGSNPITLTVTNSRNLTATATVNVIVQAVVDNPGPTLTAGPLAVAWHVKVGETALQTAALYVGNSGSGDLQFTATSGAPWLVLNAAGGTAPATLTLTGNPTGIADGVIMKTKVTLTAVGLPTQVIEIPVTLSVGNTFAIGAEPEPEVDQCPNDATKVVPGVCGCGVSDADSDGDGVADCQDAGQDLAVTKISAPSTLTLKGNAATLTKTVKVQLQNRGPNSETIASLNALAQLVSLTTTSLGTCPAPVPVLLPAKSQKKLPLTLKSKQKLDVLFQVTFACANDPAKSKTKDPGHDDYSLVAHVSRAALGGNPDTHPADDGCPRSVTPPFALDPNPNGKIKDKGCGKKKPDKTLGAPIVVDVVVKP